MEFQAKGLTSELSKAESDISQAAQALSKTIETANVQRGTNGSDRIPDPIKLIRRLTALEVSFSHLRNDCELVSKKRNDLVREVLTTQNETVQKVQELLERTEHDDPYSSRDDMEDESWNAMTRRLGNQQTMLESSING